MVMGHVLSGRIIGQPDGIAVDAELATPVDTELATPGGAGEVVERLNGARRAEGAR
ncbi:hypothetical protein AB0I22_38600 [Streptomyces sp. NPDC050610]|uniref:hypothetical protein n=1 Tax=Streptomyces sp. NPDC050610 TaxID=3157097 RepID=UPI003441439B